MERNNETHRHFNIILNAYDQYINNRFKQLNIDDYVFNNKIKPASYTTIPKSKLIDCCITADLS